MDLKTYGEQWLTGLLARDPVVILCAALLGFIGLCANYFAMKLGGRTTTSLARLAWSGVKWLATPTPPSDLARAIMDEIAKHEPRDEDGHTLWYGQQLHFYCGDTIAAYIDKTHIDLQLLTKRERKRILESVRHARRVFAEKKVGELESGERTFGTFVAVKVDSP